MKKIKSKRAHLEKRILFHQNNARVQTCAVSVVKILELKLQNLLYSPDFAHSNFLLFPNSKNDVCFEDFPKSYFLNFVFEEIGEVILKNRKKST